MDQYHPLQPPQVIEHTALLHVQHPHQPPPGIDEALPAYLESLLPPLGPDLQKEFEIHRSSANFFLGKYIESLDHIRTRDISDESNPLQDLAIVTHLSADRDRMRMKVSADLAIRDLIVMQGILDHTQSISRPPSRLRDVVSAVSCTAVWALAIRIKSLTDIATEQALDSLLKSAVLVYRFLKHHKFESAQRLLHDLRLAFEEGRVDEVNRDDLDKSHFSFIW